MRKKFAPISLFVFYRFFFLSILLKHQKALSQDYRLSTRVIPTNHSMYVTKKKEKNVVTTAKSRQALFFFFLSFFRNTNLSPLNQILRSQNSTHTNYVHVSRRKTCIYVTYIFININMPFYASTCIHFTYLFGNIYQIFYNRYESASTNTLCNCSNKIIKQSNVIGEEFRLLITFVIAISASRERAPNIMPSYLFFFSRRYLYTQKFFSSLDWLIFEKSVCCDTGILYYH